MSLRVLERKPLKNNVAALETLFRLFHDSVFYAVYYITNNRTLAEDVTQETFLKAYQHLDRLRDASRVEAWLVRIAINSARDALRRDRHMQHWSSTISPTVQGNETLPENSLLFREEQKEVHAAVNSLASEYQEVIYLKYFRKMTIQEISNVTGLPEGTVKTRLRKARLKIGRQLSGDSFPATGQGDK